MSYKGTFDFWVLHFVVVIFGLMKAQEAISILVDMDGVDETTVESSLLTSPSFGIVLQQTGSDGGPMVATSTLNSTM